MRIISFLFIFLSFFTKDCFAYISKLPPISFDHMYSMAEQGNISYLLEAKSRGLNIDALNYNGDTGLCLAAKNRDKVAFNSFRAAGANLYHKCTHNIPNYYKFLNQQTHTSYYKTYEQTQIKDYINRKTIYSIGGIALIGGGIALGMSGSGGGSGTNCDKNPCAEGCYKSVTCNEGETCLYYNICGACEVCSSKTEPCKNIMPTICKTGYICSKYNYECDVCVECEKIENPDEPNPDEPDDPCANVTGVTCGTGYECSKYNYECGKCTECKKIEDPDEPNPDEPDDPCANVTGVTCETGYECSKYNYECGKCVACKEIVDPCENYTGEEKYCAENEVCSQYTCGKCSACIKIKDPCEENECNAGCYKNLKCNQDEECIENKCGGCEYCKKEDGTQDDGTHDMDGECRQGLYKDVNCDSGYTCGERNICGGCEYCIENGNTKPNNFNISSNTDVTNNQTLKNTGDDKEGTWGGIYIKNKKLYNSGDITLSSSRIGSGVGILSCITGNLKSCLIHYSTTKSSDITNTGNINITAPYDSIGILSSSIGNLTNTGNINIKGNDSVGIALIGYGNMENTGNITINSNNIKSLTPIYSVMYHNNQYDTLEELSYANSNIFFSNVNMPNKKGTTTITNEGKLTLNLQTSLDLINSTNYGRNDESLGGSTIQIAFDESLSEGSLEVINNGDIDASFYVNSDETFMPAQYGLVGININGRNVNTISSSGFDSIIYTADTSEIIEKAKVKIFNDGDIKISSVGNSTGIYASRSYISYKGNMELFNNIQNIDENPFGIGKDSRSFGIDGLGSYIDLYGSIIMPEEYMYAIYAQGGVINFREGSNTNGNFQAEVVRNYTNLDVKYATVDNTFYNYGNLNFDTEDRMHQGSRAIYIKNMENDGSITTSLKYIKNVTNNGNINIEYINLLDPEIFTNNSTGSIIFNQTRINDVSTDFKINLNKNQKSTFVNDGIIESDSTLYISSKEAEINNNNNINISFKEDDDVVSGGMRISNVNGLSITSSNEASENGTVFYNNGRINLDFQTVLETPVTDLYGVSISNVLMNNYGTINLAGGKNKYYISATNSIVNQYSSIVVNDSKYSGDIYGIRMNGGNLNIDKEAEINISSSGNNTTYSNIDYRGVSLKGDVSGENKSDIIISNSVKNAYGIYAEQTSTEDGFINSGTIDVKAANNAIGMYAKGYVDGTTENDRYIKLINSDTGKISASNIEKYVAYTDRIIAGMYIDGSNSSVINNGSIDVKIDGDFNNYAFNAYGIVAKSSDDKKHNVYVENTGDINVKSSSTDTNSNIGGIYLHHVIANGFNEGTITLDAKKGNHVIGILVTETGEDGFVNHGNITIKNGYNGVGMVAYGENNKGDEYDRLAKVINASDGIINVASNGGIGMYADGSKSYAINYGTINLTGENTHDMIALNGGTITNEQDNTEPTNVGILVTNGATFINKGTINSDSSINLDDMQNNASLVAGLGSVINAQSIKGNLFASSDVTLGENKDIYINSDVIKAKDDGIILSSKSVMFETSLQQNTNSSDIVYQRKNFEDLLGKNSISEYLETNYNQGNIIDIFDNFKQAENINQLIKNTNKSLGTDFIPVLAYQDINRLRYFNNSVEDMLREETNEEERSLVKSDNYYSDYKSNKIVSGYEDKIYGVNAWFDKIKSNNIRYGIGFSIYKANSEYDDKYTRDDNIFIAYLGTKYETDKLGILSMPYLGYSNGEYDRDNYNSNIENMYFGLNNKFWLNKKIFRINIKPTTELNVNYINTDTINETKGINVKTKDILSVESGIGVVLNKNFELSSNKNLDFELGATYYYELNNNIFKNMNAKLNNTNSYYKINGYNNNRSRGVINFNTVYNINKFNIYGKFLMHINDNENISFNAGIKYGF